MEEKIEKKKCRSHRKRKVSIPLYLWDNLVSKWVIRVKALGFS
jgi:hypothetical protein